MKQLSSYFDLHRTTQGHNVGPMRDKRLDPAGMKFRRLHQPIGSHESALKASSTKRNRKITLPEIKL